MSQLSRSRSIAPKSKGSKKSSQRKVTVRQARNNKAARVRPPKMDRDVTQLAPSAVGNVHYSKLPVTRRSRDSYFVSHEELIINAVAGSVAWEMQVDMVVNPGDPYTFPWLHTTASQFEQFKLHRLAFRWVPVAGTSTQGDVIMSYSYDPSDPLPQSETQAANMRPSVVFNCWQRGKLTIDPTSAMNGLSRKDCQNIVAYGDPRVVDLGRLYISTANQLGTDIIGKIWVEYEFEFFNPTVDLQLATPVPRRYVSFEQDTDIITTDNEWTAVTWDRTYGGLISGYNPSGHIILPRGTYALWGNASLQSTQAGSSTTFIASLRITVNGVAWSDPAFTRGRGNTAVTAITSNALTAFNLSICGLLYIIDTDIVQMEFLVNNTGGSSPFAEGQSINLMVTPA